MDTVLQQGFCIKQGAVVSNWKRRYMILRKDGCIYYYRPDRDGNYAAAKPKGVIREFVDVINGESQGMTDWPKDAPPSCRFSLPGRERTYHLYCETAFEAQQWIAALSNVVDNRDKLAQLGVV